MTDTKKTRTPRTAEAITKGALALPLEERIVLVKQLRASIGDEVAILKASADNAVKLTEGL